MLFLLFMIFNWALSTFDKNFDLKKTWDEIPATSSDRCSETTGSVFDNRDSLELSRDRRSACSLCSEPTGTARYSELLAVSSSAVTAQCLSNVNSQYITPLSSKYSHLKHWDRLKWTLTYILPLSGRALIPTANRHRSHRLPLIFIIVFGPWTLDPTASCTQLTEDDCDFAGSCI